MHMTGGTKIYSYLCAKERCITHEAIPDILNIQAQIYLLMASVRSLQ